MTNDDEIIAQWKASTRAMWRLVWILIGGLALVVGVIAVALLTGHAELVMSFRGQVAFAVALVVLFVITFVGIAKYYKPPPEIANPRIVRRQIDVHHRRWRIILGVNLFTTFVCVFNLSRVLPSPAAVGSMWPLAVGFCVALLPILFAFVLSVGPGWQGMAEPGLSEILDDEFVRNLRARTMRFGYVLLMVLMGAVLLTGIVNPALTLPALCWALFAGFAVPTLYYIVADWRAGREG